MRKYSLTLLVTAAFGLAAIQAAAAADMPMKSPAYHPQPIPFTWTGFYGGVHAGWGWDNSSADVAFPPATFDAASLDQNDNGFVGGGQIGYNYQFAPNWVVGIEGDFSGTDIRGTTTNPLTAGGVQVGAGINNLAQRDVRWLATARGRLGFAADRWLIYVTGGGAWGEMKYTAGPAFAGLWSPVAFSHTSSGWTAGGGVEYGFTNNWTARVEYLYYDLDGASIVNPSAAAGLAATQTWDRNRINVVRVGVNYKF